MSLIEFIEIQTFTVTKPRGHVRVLLTQRGGWVSYCGLRKVKQSFYEGGFGHWVGSENGSEFRNNS